MIRAGTLLWQGVGPCSDYAEQRGEDKIMEVVTKDGIHTDANVALVYYLLDKPIEIHNSEGVQDAQRSGAADYDYGNAHGYSAAGEWSPGTVERLAYDHGYKTGHEKCTCAVTGGPDDQEYSMHQLPERL